MSFTQRYKRDIIELLNRNLSGDRKKNKLDKIKYRGVFQMGSRIPSLKYKNKTKISSETHISHISELTFDKALPLFKNQQIKTKLIKNVGTNKEHQKKKPVPIFKITYRKSNILIQNKIKFEQKNLRFLKNIDDEINKEMDVGTKSFLSKNNTKFKIANRIERQNFYSRIRNAFDDIRLIKKKNFSFNKSLFLFKPLHGEFKQMMDNLG